MSWQVTGVGRGGVNDGTTDVECVSFENSPVVSCQKICDFIGRAKDAKRSVRTLNRLF
jgi:hypothetical protein